MHAVMHKEQKDLRPHEQQEEGGKEKGHLGKFGFVRKVEHGGETWEKAVGPGAAALDSFPCRGFGCPKSFKTTNARGGHEASCRPFQATQQAERVAEAKSMVSIEDFSAVIVEGGSRPKKKRKNTPVVASMVAPEREDQTRKTDGRKGNRGASSRRPWTYCIHSVYSLECIKL